MTGNRRDFPTRVRAAVIKRCTTKNGTIYCEACGLPTMRFQIDHVRPDGLCGEPTIENAMLICETCYGEKNPQDTRKIAKAKRQEAAHIGAKQPTKQPLKSRGFEPSGKAPKIEKTSLAHLPTEIQRRFGVTDNNGDIS